MRHTGTLSPRLGTWSRCLRLSRRSFVASSSWRIATPEMSAGDVAALKVKQDRLMNDIHHTCQWGKGEAWGE